LTGLKPNLPGEMERVGLYPFNTT